MMILQMMTMLLIGCRRDGGTPLGQKPTTASHVDQPDTLS